MRAAIYTRASLDRTGEGKSNARQEEECQRLIAYKRWELVATEADISISAYGDKERPAWLRVLKMIEERQVDVVVAYHLDRLTRNMADLERLIVLCEENNVVVATATGDIDLTNDTGRMVARILAAVARQEVERKAARQKLAHAQRRAEGRPWAAVKMLGYERDGTIIEEEAAAIRQAAQDALDDRMSLAEIGRHWHELGLTSPYKSDDKPWTPRGVKTVLTNPRLAGFVTHDGEVIGEGNWEPILDETMMTLLIAKLNDPSRVSGKSKMGRKAANLLTGIMVCSKCGNTVRAGSAHGKVKTYVCNEWHVSVVRQDADDLVRSAFAAAVALVSPGSILESPTGKVDQDDIASKVDALKERQGVLAMSFARGQTSTEQFESAAEALAQEIKTLEALWLNSGEKVDWGAVRAESVRNFLSSDMAEQRKVLKRLAKITCHPADAKHMNARRQIEVMVKGKRGGRDILIPAHLRDLRA